ncbi:mtDNA inheritance, partitioning of the mitochondrial organelle [Mortierella sp. AM989]|nr:mtDNA inheritance, partitioning of the mitochondrial organelle [Mortierella sp. AM989]
MPETQTAEAPAGAKVSDTSAALDREKVHGTVLECFMWEQSSTVDDFSPTSTPPASSELRLYTWKNATLGEITSLVKQAIPDLVSQAGSGGQLAFRHIYLDVNRGLFVGRDIGTVRLDNNITPSASAAAAVGDDVPTQGLFTKNTQNTAGGAGSIARGAASASTAKSGPGGGGSKAYEKTLESIRFVIGDYLDIAITSPTAAGFIPPINQRQQQHGPGGGGPIRNQRGGPRSGGGRHGGGGGAGGGGPRMDPLGDRFAGRLGGGFGRNGHGQGFGGRKRTASLEVHTEQSWRGRGRGR